ncbi:MAG: twin-arginine translocation signal domain-containing protein, partial [Planctomycetota bacterium]|nr:twin-arginine translocation signal domain-containing protein [Planctomycetota bacterium]
MQLPRECPECLGDQVPTVNRRDFVRVVSLAGAAAAGGLLGQSIAAEPEKKPASETLVQKLFSTLSAKQKEEICFPWDYQDDRGLLRTHVSNNWNITDAAKLNVGGEFYTAEQRDLIRQIFMGLYNPDWHERILKQLQDDAGGYGKSQTIAIFGEPGAGKSEFVMTGRHLTVRCDGDSTDHMAFGGPIFYGHAASG